MRILVADDSRLSRFFLSSILSDQGHEVIEAKDGKEAKDLLNKKSKIDLIISDILMPEIDGYKLCSWIRSQTKYKNTPIILFTGTYTDPEDEDFARMIGANAFLRKTDKPEVIIATINRIASESLPETKKSDGDLHEAEVYRLYNERLVNKLEKKTEELDHKIIQLEEEIHQRKLVEKALIEEKKFAEMIFDAAQAIMVLIDTSGNIVRINPILERISGYSLKEVRGKSWRSIFDPRPVADQGQNEKSLYLSLLEKEAKNFRISSIRTKKGDRRIIEWNETELCDADGKIQGLLAAGRDITDLIRIHENLISSRTQDTADRMVKGIMRDLDRILSEILSSIEGLDEPGGKAILTAQSIKRIKKAADSANRLLCRLKNLSSDKTVCGSRIDISMLVKKAAGSLKKSVTNKSIKININGCNDLPPVWGDQKELEAVFAAVLENSLWAIQDEGSIKIECSILEEKQKQKNDKKNYACIRITDTGRGIPKSILHRVYEPYFSTDRNKSGLGLAEAYAVIRKHGGTIKIKSHEGISTTVEIRLPLFAGKE